MLNPTLSDLIGGIQSVTLGDEEARRRRTQKSVLERKAPPTFDVIVEIQDRERVTVHADVADTVDAMLRGDPVAPELRWRDEEGVHRSQGRPRPSPREQLGAERFAGPGRGRLAVADGARLAWRRRRLSERRLPRGRPRFGRAARLSARRDRRLAGRPVAGRAGSRRPVGPHRRVAGPAPCRVSGSRRRRRGPRDRRPGRPLSEVPFVAGDIADRGPLERGAPLTAAETRAREARELERQKAWSEQASRALTAMKAEDGTGPVNADDLEDDDLDRHAARRRGRPRRWDGPGAGRLAAADPARAAPGDQPQAARAGRPRPAAARSSSRATWTRPTSS